MTFVPVFFEQTSCILDIAFRTVNHRLFFAEKKRTTEIIHLGVHLLPANRILFVLIREIFTPIIIIIIIGILDNRPVDVFSSKLLRRRVTSLTRDLRIRAYELFVLPRGIEIVRRKST